MALSTTSLLFFSLVLLLFLHAPVVAAAARGGGGSWKLLHASIGISAMHMQLLPNDRVVMFDRTDAGPSNISLPLAKCNADDCSAHSVEYDVASNSVRPLKVLTETWCSSGSLMPDGTLAQTGGWNEGIRVVRHYKSCGECDWQETPNGLIHNRWYATNHILPDGQAQIIIGGRGSFNYEFYPATDDKAFALPFLAQTNDPKVENNLYPFVFLNHDGNLFIFANNRAILFDYTKNRVVKTYPAIPGGEPRNYPSSASAVLLPLNLRMRKVEVEVLICGGAQKGAYMDAQNGKFKGALDSCGRIKISDGEPRWVMEAMPLARVMGDMLLLPNGHVLNINGFSAGSAGWEFGRDPVLSPLIYRPDYPIGHRFEIQNPSAVPRMYHSTAILLRDGRVLVSGSNPHLRYEFKNVRFPTELSLEAFAPSYLDDGTSRPSIIGPPTNTLVRYGQRMVIQFDVAAPVDPKLVYVTMVAPPFTTHAFSMNQRLLVLDGGLATKVAGKPTYQVVVAAPPSANIAPAGNYMLFLVHKEIPSAGIWVRIH